MQSLSKQIEDGTAIDDKLFQSSWTDTIHRCSSGDEWTLEYAKLLCHMKVTFTSSQVVEMVKVRNRMCVWVDV